MAPSKTRMSKAGTRGTPALGLRDRALTQELDADQETLLGVFVAACVVSECAVYVRKDSRRGTIVLKVYDGDDAYEEWLEAKDFTTELFDDFSKTLGAQAHYRALLNRMKPVMARYADKKA